jgi:hypothetical protein
MLLRVGDQLLHIGDRKLRIHHEYDRRDREQRDRREVARWIEGQALGVERRVDDEGARGGEQQRVAVRVRLGDVGKADNAAGAGLGLDHHRLANALRNLVEHDAADGVGGATCLKGTDDADRP